MATLANVLPSPIERCDDLVAFAEYKQAMFSAIEQLPEKEKQVMILTVSDELSTSEKLKPWMD